jgi:hypothetical protein
VFSIQRWRRKITKTKKKKFVCFGKGLPNNVAPLKLTFLYLYQIWPNNSVERKISGSFQKSYLNQIMATFLNSFYSEKKF